MVFGAKLGIEILGLGGVGDGRGVSSGWEGGEVMGRESRGRGLGVGRHGEGGMGDEGQLGGQIG